MASIVRPLVIRRVGTVWLLAFILSCAGCGGLPRDVDRPVSTALADDLTTALGELAHTRRPARLREFAGTWPVARFQAHAASHAQQAVFPRQRMGNYGGHNHGDAYFGYSEDSNFIDLNVLVAGPVVREMSLPC